MSGREGIRRKEMIVAVPPSSLTLCANDRLRPHDPATGRTIEMEAFGATNEAAFARLLR